jgi:DNA-binding MarR family transcriptional regulator
VVYKFYCIVRLLFIKKFIITRKIDYNMKYIYDNKSKVAIPTEVLKEKKAIKVLTHPIRWEILKLLSEKPYYPLKIAKILKLHEQKVYYHLHLLRKYNFIEEKKSEGGISKYYTTKPTAYSIIPNWVKSKIREVSINAFAPPPKILEGFIEDGKINSKIVVGGTIPHGKLKRISRSSFIAGEIAVVLGKYGQSEERLVYTDIDLPTKKDNLIVISGMHVNTIQKELNNYLPIKFDKSGNKIISTISKEEYSEPDTGFICKIRNPFDKSKNVIVIAGLESTGTKAAVFAFKNYLTKISKGNMYNRDVIARVVYGVEKNGEIKSIEFLE